MTDAVASAFDFDEATPVGHGKGPAALIVNGWTVFTPSPDSRIIYVSRSLGHDANSGLSELAPKRTIAAGLSEMRHGMPDWLLLRKGDAFSAAEVPSGGYRWLTSGRSAAEPALFSSYGPASAPRPHILTLGKPGLSIAGGGGSPPLIEHVAIVGLEFACGRHDATQLNPTAIRLQWPVVDLLVEDCKLSRFAVGIVAQLTGGYLYDVRIRRSVIHDSYSGNGSHAQGIYCDEVDGLLIEECVIDHGGWTEVARDANPPDIFKHGIYVQGDARNVVVRGNIISNASSHGLQMRNGGIVDGNLFVRNPIGLLMAGDGSVHRNLFLDGRDITPTLPRRQALHIQNIATGLNVTDNIIGVSQPSTSSKAIVLQPLDLGTGTWLGMRNVNLERNVIWNWGGQCLDVLDFASRGAVFANIVIRSNDLQSLVDSRELVRHQAADTIGPMNTAFNRFHGEQVPANAWVRVGSSSLSIQAYLALMKDSTSSSQLVEYPAPSRTIETYHASVGGAATYGSFLAEALRQSKSNWRPAYTANAVNTYVRAGFALAP